MLETEDGLKEIMYTVHELLKADKLNELIDIIDNAEITIEQTGYDNWNGGIYFYTIHLLVDIGAFVKIRDKIETVESALLEKFGISTRHLEKEGVSNIIIVPKAKPKIDWSLISGLNSKGRLIEDINYLKNIMISVSTGGQRIQDVNNEFKKKYYLTNKTLQKLHIKNPNPFKDLWEWYAEWSSKIPTYNGRRIYIGEIYNPLLQIIEETEQPELISVTIDLTDWERIERSINEIKHRQNEAKTEEQFQVIGLLCRETIITLSQAVFIKDKHPILDRKEVSKTDAKRMLEAYISVEISGSSNETLRKYAKATLDLANELTHKRTATKKEATLCATATISLINLIGTIEGRI